MVAPLRTREHGRGFKRVVLDRAENLHAGHTCELLEAKMMGKTIVYAIRNVRRKALRKR
jgi:glycerol-3-phosphate cytidylyltransferase-like family protein